MKVSEFPIEIQERIMDCQEEQGNKRDISVFDKHKGAGVENGGFTWKDTEEKLSFWAEIINSNQFENFYKRKKRKDFKLNNLI